MVSQSSSRRIAAVSTTLQVFAVAVVLLIPVIWMALSSLKRPGEVTRYPPTVIFDPTLANYAKLFAEVPFFEYGLNSLIVSVVSTLLGLALALPCAFAISWHSVSWPATIALITRMAPGTLFVLPWFVLFSNLGMTGGYWVLILTHTVITMPLALWVLLPYFDALPRSIFESAFVDGCRGVKCLVHIAIPLVLPGLMVAIILSFIASWNYFLFALVLGGIDTKTLIVASFNFVGEGATDWGRLMAAAVLICLPPLVLIFIMQRGLISGLSGGSVKG
ncbi:carbohydrate ABC transporter permease [Bosea caraganae]|uniref:Carbohydrate ABC transporter permease n=1 Tax=Bosea caraganae TaxID=2763117 RepID=A0A370L9P1_9HYPH|nr:carbohydrate ABC transporter permease [Bosea caraganae]RDJ26692.1 carbohydrate ABC transporter permease [Bosea caraganae]RDJ30580.1 carbohydrate ABC transporter permease [Bosea caraganae]